MKKLVISQEFRSSSSIVDASNSALTTTEISSRQLKSLHLENNDLTEVVIDGCDNRNGLREIYLQNNNLGTGYIQIGSFSYDNRSWSSRDWKVYSCLTTLVAYGNNIYGTHGQSTVTWRSDVVYLQTPSWQIFMPTLITMLLEVRAGEPGWR